MAEIKSDRLLETGGPEDVWDCRGMWGRYSVEWQTTGDDGDAGRRLTPHLA